MLMWQDEWKWKRLQYQPKPKVQSLKQMSNRFILFNIIALIFQWILWCCAMRVLRAIPSGITHTKILCKPWIFLWMKKMGSPSTAWESSRIRNFSLVSFWTQKIKLLIKTKTEQEREPNQTEQKKYFSSVFNV